ncbi:MAG: RHS repeat-associated core domain-containing protein [Lacipirellulaceae bacterium]
MLRDRDADGNAGNGLEERLYAPQDAQYNVVALVTPAGTPVERFHYTAYGESRALTPSDGARTASLYDWRIRYTGRELDLETGLQINRHRYYHPTLGRWVRRDPIGYDGGDSNLYDRRALRSHGSLQ